MDYILACENCNIPLEITSSEELFRMRQPGSGEENKIICCKKCNNIFTVTTRVEAALQHGYDRLNKPKPTNEKIDDLMWQSLRRKPLPQSKDELDLWTLDFASIQMRVNLHDWRHRKSCLKNGRKKCRYNIPPLPTFKTCVEAIYESESDDAEGEYIIHPKEHTKICELQIDVKKQAPFLFFTDCNAAIMSVLNCNNCVKYVKDQKVSLYYGAYTTKHSSDCEKALSEAVNAIEKYCAKLVAEQERAEEENTHILDDNGVETAEEQLTIPIRSEFSKGLGKLLSGVRAATKGETVGAPLAALVLRGISIFEMSHKTAVLPLTQALAYLEGEEIRASINREGIVSATTYDYVYRSHNSQENDSMNLWDFIKTQETCRQGKEGELDEIEDENGERVEVFIPSNSKARVVHKFSEGHPQDQTHGHRSRTHMHWARYLAKRLPDLSNLETANDEILPDEREEQRTEYAKGVLTMFVPWREKSDLVLENETWWDAYLRQKESLYDDKATRQTLNAMQNYYESFCRGTPETEDFDFTAEEINEIREQENIEENENAEEIINLENVDDELLIDTPLSDDPFINKLNLLEENHLDLQVRNWQEIVSRINAKAALDLITANKKKGFCLPGRASLGLSVEESNPPVDDPLMDTHLDTPIGKSLLIISRAVFF